MLRAFLCFAMLALIDVSARAEHIMTATESVIRLNVQPMPSPQPALRYLLLPDLKEMTPGNPIPTYLACLMDQDFSSKMEVLTRSALRQADRAARMDKPDWQILLKLKADGIGLLLPDVQKLRALAAGLQDRLHTEIALGRFDDALVTTKTMFALSRHLSEHPTLIGDLVGIAIASIAIGQLEDMLEQSGCPNLYWALTNLPSPLVPLDKGVEGERMIILAELRDLSDAVPMSADQINKLVTHIDKLQELEQKSKDAKGARVWLNARINDKGKVDEARRRLVAVGFSDEKLQRFPTDQVILLDEKREYEVRRDEIMKIMKLPYWQSNAFFEAATPAVTKALFDFLVPAMDKIQNAQARLEQRLALLRHVEALRMYAAGHDGKLPVKLSDIAVPLPADPITGKPFAYSVEGATAHLRGTPPRGTKGIAAFNVHFEVTIKK